MGRRHDVNCRRMVERLYMPQSRAPSHLLQAAAHIHCDYTCREKFLLVEPSLTCNHVLRLVLSCPHLTRTSSCEHKHTALFSAPDSFPLRPVLPRLPPPTTHLTPRMIKLFLMCLFRCRRPTYRLDEERTAIELLR
jgi:hypothetical protein